MFNNGLGLITENREQRTTPGLTGMDFKYEMPTRGSDVRCDGIFTITGLKEEEEGKAQAVFNKDDLGGANSLMWYLNPSALLWCVLTRRAL